MLVSVRAYRSISLTRVGVDNSLLRMPQLGIHAEETKMTRHYRLKIDTASRPQSPGMAYTQMRDQHTCARSDGPCPDP